MDALHGAVADETDGEPAPRAGAAAGEAYGALAPFYDEFVAHPGYRHWVLGIERHARTLGVRGVRLLDVGCGTGRSFSPLLGRGYLVTACDPVAAMLAQARRRSPRRVRTVAASASHLPPGRFDLVLALNDVINSLDGQDELARTFAAVATVLAPDGVFAFDLTPRRTFEQVFRQTARRATARARFRWSPLDDEQPADPDRFAAALVAEAAGRRATTVHRQRHYDLVAVQGALERAGLRLRSLRGCANDGTLGEPGGDAFKHVLFAQSSNPDANERRCPPC